MVRNWKQSAAKAIFEGCDPGKGFPADLVKSVRRRLQSLDEAKSLQDLRAPPSNRLHELKGDRKGQWAICVNNQWRICFKWGPEGPEDVEFVDYH